MSAQNGCMKVYFKSINDPMYIGLRDDAPII